MLQPNSSRFRPTDKGSRRGKLRLLGIVQLEDNYVVVYEEGGWGYSINILYFVKNGTRTIFYHYVLFDSNHTLGTCIEAIINRDSKIKYWGTYSFYD
jgi:hypothetical protein